jgi:cytidylate kinase
MAVITISRLFGAGGWTLGQRLAETLGYRYVHEEMIREVAKQAGVSLDQIRGIEKEGKTKLMQFIDMIVSKEYIDRLISDKYKYVDEARFVDSVRSVVLNVYEEGNCIIVGRGSQFILQDYEKTLHILLVDDLDRRIRFIMEKYEQTEEKAEQTVRRADEIRTRFLNFFADKSMHNDPHLYDLCFNMKHLTMDQVEKVVLNVAPK